MREIVRTVLDPLASAYRHGIPLVLLFDYDGTLAPIVEHPQAATLPLPTRQVLTRLAQHANVEVGVLSGRTLDDLKAMLALPGFYLAGTSGLELDLRGTRIEHPRARKAMAVMEMLAARLDTALAAYPGAWLERKRLGLTVHYRQLAGHLLGALQTSVAQVTSTVAGELRIVQGSKAWEITPCPGWTKGTAVRLILADIGATDASLLYAGDEANDADAMQVVAAMGGITLGIGSHAPTAAQYRLPSPATLLTFLGGLEDSLERRMRVAARSATNYRALYGFWRSTLPTNPM